MPPFTAAPTICVAPLFPVLYVIMKVGRSHEEVNQFSQQERAHSCRLQGVVHDCFQGTKYDDLARFRRILSPLYRSRTVKSISRLFDSVPVRRFLCSSHVGVQNKTQRHHSSWLFTAMKLPCDRPIARVHSQEPKTTLFVLSLTRFALPKMVPEIFLFLIERGDEKHNSVTSSRFSQSSSTLPIPLPPDRNKPHYNIVLLGGKNTQHPRLCFSSPSRVGISITKKSQTLVSSSATPKGVGASAVATGFRYKETISLLQHCFHSISK